MRSLFDDLSEKLARDSSVTKRSGPRADLGLLMFNARDDVAALWRAADAHVRSGGEASLGELRDAVDALRPLFGERPDG
jgi:hypothetical protein